MLRNLPILSTDLISLHPVNNKSRPPETYVCIMGLNTEEDIVKFENALNRASFSFKHYRLQLCYLLNPILRSATLEISAIPASQHQTYCGRLMSYQLEDGSVSISTVGGLILVDGQTYALTTNHNPEEQPREAPRRECEQEKETILQPMMKPGKIVTAGDRTLALIQPSDRLPNVIANRLPESTIGRSELGVVKDYYYFDMDSRVFLDSRKVLIACGKSGWKQGFISNRRTFLLSQTRSLQKVWSIDLGNNSE